MKVEIESLKKTQKEIKLEMKNSESPIKPSEVSLTNRVKTMEESLRHRR